MKQFPQLRLCLLVVFAFTLFNCVSNKIPENSISPGVVSPETDDQARKGVSRVDELLSAMNLEEKIGQLFIIDIRKPVTGDPIQIVNEYVEELITTYRPGGVILFGGNIRNPAQVRSFIRGLQNLAEIPMFISTDEEGGPISRLNYSAEMPRTELPSALLIGKTQIPGNAHRAGRIIGKELRSLGFNMNNAPVADILTNPRNPVIGPRSFGTDPESVGEMVASFIQGLQEEHVIAVMKHFPGHGDTIADSHSGKVSVKHTLERIENIEMIPFIMGIEAGGRAIMTAHINVPAVEDIPATFSKVLIHDFLRNTVQFNGVVISDSLGMGAISHYYAPSIAPVLALKAGVDLILIPDIIEEGYAGVRQAVLSGEITLYELDQKVRKILELKEQFGLLSELEVPDLDAPYEIEEAAEFYRYIQSHTADQ